MNLQLCKTTGLLLSTLACALSTQTEAATPYRCVVGGDGGWLCGPSNEITRSSGTPLSEVVPPPPPKRVATPRIQPPAVQPTAEQPTGAVTQPAPAPLPRKEPEEAETTTPAESTQESATAATPATIEQAATATAESAPETEQQIVSQPVEAGQCPIERDSKRGPSPIARRDDQVTTIDADEMEVHERNLFHYSGNVVMQRADQQLSTDQATYNHESGIFEAEGNLLYRETGSEMAGDRGHFNANTDSGVIHNARYKIEESHASGEAERAEKLGNYVSRYTSATYTTCDPNNRSWEMEADEVELDDIEGWGTATNAVVRFQNVPILYTPSFTFPMDERRKSGFLFPDWGYEDVGGGLLSLPYYWNIAPNRDATITPRLIAKRGLLLDGNYRYLNSDFSGELDAGFLPSDDLYKDDRWQLKFAHNGKYGGVGNESEQPWSYDINYASLSDRNYLDDLGNTLGLSSSDTLEQTAKLTYTQERWSASTLFSDHYTVGKRGVCSDNTSTTERACSTNGGTWSVENITGDNEPYRKLPQIDASWSNESNDNQLNYSLTGQFTHFDHDTKITGERLSLTPGVNYKQTFLNDSLWLTPSISVIHSRYDLNSSVNKSPQRTIPTYKLEGGVYFERDVHYDLFGGSYLQELTPTLTYTYIPDGRNSNLTSELSDFDSTTISAEESELLKSTFVGSDKATHTKQLNIKLSTTFTEEESSEKALTASIEQAINFISSEKSASNLVGKLGADSGNHHTDLELSWDPYDNQDDTVSANYQYRPDNDHIFNIGHSYSRDSKEQYDLSAAWRIGSFRGGNWNLLGRYNYELMDPNSHTLEELGGIVYDTCCWALRFTRNRYFEGTETFDGAERNKFDTKWFLTLELKGLGNLGKRQRLDTLLTESIKGYKPEEQ